MTGGRQRARPECLFCTGRTKYLRMPNIHAHERQSERRIPNRREPSATYATNLYKFVVLANCENIHNGKLQACGRVCYFRYSALSALSLSRLFAASVCFVYYFSECRVSCPLTAHFLLHLNKIKKK